MINSYNPDVLTCLANLSNDEVFTPPTIANAVLDLLPQNLWSNKEATFLDPVCKSGVFLREIAKRLINGLQDQIPNLQERLNHIYTKQLYGIAITELTALLSRRTVYCSKHANSTYSVCTYFTDIDGNIRFTQTPHRWQNGKCTFCGANRNIYERSGELETHAYQFIHTATPEELFSMKFDVIIGNPPYQMSDGGDKNSDITRGGAVPIYQKFVEQAKKMAPRFLVMIIPSRWFAGGRGLDDFRAKMLEDNRISILVDFPIAAEVFPGIKLNGGVCYFLWERDNRGMCKVISCIDDKSDEMIRPLNEFSTFVRFNKAIPIVKKINQHDFIPLSLIVSKQKPFGLRTYERPTGNGTIKLYANKEIGLIEKKDIIQGFEILEQWKVLISRGYGEGGEARPYPRMVIGRPIIAEPNSACTETYLVLGCFKDKHHAENLATYLTSKFLRFLVALKKNTQDIISERFSFVPLQDFNESWTDEKLYKKYNLTQEEIDFIEKMIRPME